VRRLALVVPVLLILVLPVSASSRARVPRFADCGLAKLEPPTIVLACADAGFTLGNLRWTRWQWGGAVGRGTAWRNRCVPNCAAGHFDHWAVTVRLYRAHFCRRYDRVLFTRVAWRAAGPAPKSVPASGRAGTLGVPLVHACP
jgi:hypothetical protein